MSTKGYIHFYFYIKISSLQERCYFWSSYWKTTDKNVQKKHNTHPNSTTLIGKFVLQLYYLIFHSDKFWYIVQNIHSKILLLKLPLKLSIKAIYRKQLSLTKLTEASLEQVN